MVTPADRIEEYERKKGYSKWIFTLGIGGFLNLLPFINYDEIIISQLVFLGINTIFVAVSIAIYIYNRYRINQIKGEVISELKSVND